MRRRATAAVAATLVASTAAAYLPPAAGILKLWGRHRDALHLHSLVVRGSYTFHGEAARAAAAALKVADAGEQVTLPAEGYFKMPGRCAVTVQAATGVPADAATAVNNAGRYRSTGPELWPLKVHAQLACPLLYQRTTQAGDADALLGEWLGKLGVDLVSSVALVRFSGSVAYIVGAKPRDLGRPQLWVNKETFEPMRLVGAVDGVAYDVRLLDYTSPNSGEWHPRVVEFRQGEALVARFAADKVDANVRLSDAYF